jgi:hypothetical protein
MSPLSPEQWQVLSPYLDRALTLSKEECALWLQSLCTEKPEVADKLRGLLKSIVQPTKKDIWKRVRHCRWIAERQGRTLVHTD